MLLKIYIGKLASIKRKSKRSSNLHNIILCKITHLCKLWKYDYNDGSNTHIVSMFKMRGAIILNRLYL
jgi:hypothetical protein